MESLRSPEIECVSGGQAVVRTLERSGVRIAFGMPGVDNLPIYDALLESESLRHILVRHEQGAGFMADGYARSTLRVGVCITTTGPGALNTATSLAAAYADGSPLLLIASQTESALIGRGKGVSHDMRDQLGVFESITGWARRAESVEAIPDLVHEALRATRGPRPGPAYLEIPADVLASCADVRFGVFHDRTCPQASPEDLQRAARSLAESKRPVLIAGGGVRWSEASAELTRLAELRGAPVLTTMAGKGAIPETHPLSFGVCWGRWSAAAELLKEADLVLAVGTRLGAMDTEHWRFCMPERLIHVDIDPNEIGRNYPIHQGLVGDARATLRMLLDALRAQPDENRRPWLRLEDYRDQALAPLADRPELDFVRDLAGSLPASCVVVNDAPTIGYWLMAFWPANTPNNFMTAAYGSLGFGLPAALGVRAGRSDVPILAVCGDGGLLFTSQEMATAIREHLPIVVLVVNDESYGSVRIIQEAQYAGRASQVQLANPDFVKYAQAFGFNAVRLSDPKQVSSAITSALSAAGPYLIELPATFGLPTLN